MSECDLARLEAFECLERACRRRLRVVVALALVQRVSQLREGQLAYVLVGPAEGRSDPVKDHSPVVSVVSGPVPVGTVATGLSGFGTGGSPRYATRISSENSASVAVLAIASASASVTGVPRALRTV